MHAIKKNARRLAWYDSGVNPYGRVNSRKSKRNANADEEATLTHISTENDAVSPIEQRRHDQFGARDENGRSLNAAPKTKTWSGPDSSETSKEKETLSEPSSDSSGANPDARQNEAPEGIVDRPVGSNESSAQPRRRRGRKFFAKLGLKKRDNEENGNASQDEKKKSKGSGKQYDTSHITVMSQIRVLLFSWINILLVAVPIGIALGNIPNFNYIAVFVVNFVAIIPLAAMLSYSTEELAMYIGEVLGGLLNASFGNAVELIVSIIALTKFEVKIVQTSLVGSMLSNLLLVLGMCFFFGGINREKQNFNITVAQTAASLLALAIGSLIIPTAFAIFTPGDGDDGVTALSRGTSVLLLIVYACYLIFQLRTHIDVYNKPSEKVPKKSSNKEPGDVFRGLATIGAGTGAAASGIQRENLMDSNARPKHPDDESRDDDDDGGEVPQLTRIGALLGLAISTVFVALCAEYMVGAINGLSTNISQEFIGLILLPIVGNAAEHATAVTVAIKDKMDLSIGVAVGSSLQIALLVFPLMVLLNWFGVGSPYDLNLYVDGFVVSVLFISIILVNYLIQDGESHWLEGVLLMTAYLIIAVAAYFYPVNKEGEVI